MNLSGWIKDGDGCPRENDDHHQSPLPHDELHHMTHSKSNIPALNQWGASATMNFFQEKLSLCPLV